MGSGGPCCGVKFKKMFHDQIHGFLVNMEIFFPFDKRTPVHKLVETGGNFIAWKIKYIIMIADKFICRSPERGF
jgi:hypothetical protein